MQVLQKTGKNALAGFGVATVTNVSIVIIIIPVIIIVVVFVPLDSCFFIFNNKNALKLLFKDF